jgi:hypothetical protein
VPAAAPVARASAPPPAPRRASQQVPRSAVPAPREVIDLVDSSDEEEGEEKGKEKAISRPAAKRPLPAPAPASTPAPASLTTIRQPIPTAAVPMPLQRQVSHSSQQAASNFPLSASCAASDPNPSRDVIELLDDSDDEQPPPARPPARTEPPPSPPRADMFAEDLRMFNSLLGCDLPPQYPPPLAPTARRPSSPAWQQCARPVDTSSSTAPSATTSSATATAAGSAAQPSLKRRRTSDTETAPRPRSGDHFFDGVKVKLEPVGFGCANCEDVIEIQNPEEVEKSARQSIEQDKKKIKSVDHEQPKSVSMGGEDDNDHDDEISYMGGNLTTMLEMPHARESCSKFPFVKPVPGMCHTTPSPANLKFCEFCYCYVCEGKASECLYWTTHSQATHKNVSWKVERSLLRSKLLLQLTPPTRRAAFIQTSLKPKIMDAGGDPNTSFKKVLDEIKPSIVFLYEEKHASKLQQYTDADFLEAIILLTNVLKKCQNDLRENSVGYRAMLYLSRALLSTKMFTASFAHPDMAQAIREDLATLSNGIAIEFSEVLLHLTTRSAQSVVDWVHHSRLENRCDVPVAVGKVKAPLVSGVIFAALKDIRACPAAVLEFCYRQGDRQTAQCFYWLIESNHVEVAKVAIDRIPKANIRRELCQQFVEEKPSNRKAPSLLKYCALLAVIAPKYNSIAGADDLLCFYASRMLRRGGVVDERASEVVSLLGDAEVESALQPVVQPFVEALLGVRATVLAEGSGVVSITNVPFSSEVHCLYYFLLSFPFFGPSAVSLKLQHAKRIISQVLLKDASADCKLLFLYYFQAWGTLNSPRNVRTPLIENINDLTCDIARELISRESSILLKLPPDVLHHWGALRDECNLSEAFTAVSFTRDENNVCHLTSSSNNKPLKVAASSSYVPLYLYSSLAMLKQKDFSRLNVLMPLMWKSFIVATIDYVVNANRFRMSNLMMFMQLLQSLDVEEKMSVMLKEIILMLCFFEAVLSSSEATGMSDSGDYKLTELLRRIVSRLKKHGDQDGYRWLFWQALLSQILKKVVGENKYDLLNFIIIEDWATLDATYFSGQGSTIVYTEKFRALLLSRPSDVNVRNKNACVYIWQRICVVSPQLINTLASSPNPTLVNTLLYHATDNISDIAPHLKSPSLYRLIHKIVHANDDSSDVPREAILSLQNQWTELKAIACQSLDVFCQDASLQPSRNDVLLSVVLNLKNTFALLFPRLTSSQDLIELFRQNMTVAETTFLADNTIVPLRHAILNNSTFRQQLSMVFQQFDFFNELENVSSLAVIEVMAILFPSVQTITTFMAKKDQFDVKLVGDVFSHFQHLLTSDFDGSDISIADSFQLFTQFSDESSLRNFFLSLYTKKMNPLVCDNFISYCFLHMQSVGREKCGMVLSWLVAFCYRFYQEVDRNLLFMLQENLLAFLRHVDCNDFSLTDSSQSSQGSSNDNDPNARRDLENSSTTTNSMALNSSDITNCPSEGVNFSAHEVYYSQLEVPGEEDLRLFRPKFAFNFLQLIVYPQTERYEALPIHLLTPREKRVTLHFIFDIEHPVVFLSTALKSGEYASLNEKIVNIPFDNVHWQKILEALLGELRRGRSDCGVSGPGDDLASPLKRSRMGAASCIGSDFLAHCMELLMNLQVMLTYDISTSRREVINGIFSHLQTLLQRSSEHTILKNMTIFKASDIMQLVERVESVSSGQQPDKVYDQIAELCFFTAAGKWNRPLDKITRYIQLCKLSFQVQKLNLKVPQDVHDVSPWSLITQKRNFRVPMSQMMVAVLPQVLSLLDCVTEQDEMAYVSSLQALISAVRADNSNIAMTLLPYVSECLESRFLQKAITSFHLTSGYCTTALWAQLINDISSNLADPSFVLFMKFLCHVTTSLHNLTSSSFLFAAASAARNGVLQRWLIVLHDLIIVDDWQKAQAVASFLFSIPKQGNHYSSEFWLKMYEKITFFNVPNLAMAICTESRCGSPSFMAALTSHTEILNALTVDMDCNSLLEEHNEGLYVLWGSMIKLDDTLVVAMMKKVVAHLLNERLTQSKKLLFSQFLPKMKNLYYKAEKFENWRKFCSESASMSHKKKPLVLILMDAMTPRPSTT